MSNPASEESGIPPTPAAADEMVVVGTPGEDNAPLQSSTPLTVLTPPATSLRDSFTPSAAPLVPGSEKNLEENVVFAQPERRSRSLFRRPIFWFAVAGAIVAVVLVVILPVYFTVIRPKNNASAGGGGGGGNGPGNSKPPKPNGLTTGGDGSTVTTDNGTEFTYHNPFGGFCTYTLSYLDPPGGGVILRWNRRGLGSQESIQRQRSGKFMDAASEYNVEVGGS